MIIKLIQAGGFMGRTKTAEEEMAAYPEALKQQLAQLFRQPVPAAAPEKSRDALQYFLEYDGKTLPLEAVPRHQALDVLIDKLKQKLQYR